MGKNNDSLFAWLVTRAEADLGIAQALALCETQRTDQIKQLETTLVGQLNKLQSQVIESRDAELMDLRSEIFACADRIARFESTQSAPDAAKQAVQELRDFGTQLIARQTELEGRYSGLKELTESFATDIRALEEETRDKLDGIRSAQAEATHFQSETRSLAERVAQAESASWQTRTLAWRNAEQLEQMGENLRREIASLNALLAALDEKQSKLSVSDTLLQEMRAKIGEIHDRLVQTQNEQIERDLRLEQLDSGLATLADRITGVEELSHRDHALLLGELSSASGFRERASKELSDLDARLDDAALHQKIQELESALRAKFQESQTQAAQKFLLLEARDLEREKHARELSARLDARLADYEARTAEQTRASANAYEELCRITAELQPLPERLAGANSAILRAQTRADSTADAVARLENRLVDQIAGLGAELARVTEQQRAPLPHNDLREIERKISDALDEIHRQVASEREGLDHWGKGLRESFAAELIGVQARLSERQSEIEHRHTALELSQEAVKATLGTLESRLTKTSSSETGQAHSSGEKSDLNALEEALSARIRELERNLAARFSELENREIEHAQRFKTFGDLESELAAIKRELSERSAAPYESAVRGLQESILEQMQQLQRHLEEKLMFAEKRAEQAAAAFDTKAAALRAELTPRHAPLSASDPLVLGMEARLNDKIEELGRHLAEKFRAFERREVEITELKENSQSLTKHLAQFGAENQTPTDTAVIAPPIVTPRPEVSKDAVSGANGKGEANLAEIQARSEKEQLIKLQETMSSEIERVRAELKERSGRWKVRKSAS